MEFSPTLLAIVPPLLAIVLAVITRQVVLSLFIAVFVGAVMLCGGNLWEGFYSTFFDYILPGFEDTDHQRILALTTFCGGLSLLLEKNGGAQAFANAVSRGAGKTRRGAQVLTWLGGVFVWFSDSTNPVLVGPICRSFTDKVKVSREKLAYIVDSTTAAVPTLFPISAWGAYIIGLIATFYTSTGYTGNPQTDFVAGIPYQYYTIGSILMVLIIAVTGWDYGPMKKAEDRALLTGKLFRDGAEIRREVEQEELPEGAKPSIWNMLVPVIVLLVFIFVGLFYTGDIKSDLELPVTTLDFTGWKQINVPLPQYFTLSGVVIYAPSTTDATWDHIQVTYADTPRSGTVYIDQITAAFPGTVDNAPPVVTATLDQQNWAVDIKVSDGVDGILPLSSITVARNGDTGQVLEGYDTATGTMKYYLPGPGEANEATRVTVTAADASGNIGRASVDIPPYGVSHKFTDIDDYWAADYVDFLYNADITTGYSDGTFRPNQNISRAQFAVMLYRYLKLDANKYESVSLPFADLGQIPAYALPAAKALYSEGIITGSEKNGKLYFNPDSSLTRAQAAAMIGRTQAKGYAEAELTFTDNGKIPAYAAPYIRTMTAQGIISGYSDGSFKPNNNITRGQMAKILYNLM